MTIKQQLIALILLCSSLNCVQAQNDKGTVKGENFDVVKAYEPVLADALKVDISPELPSYEDLAKNKPVFNDYYVPSRLLSLTYEPPALKPLPYGEGKGKTKDKITDDLQHLWLRAGFGNLTTPLVDLSISSGKSDKFTLGANAFYNSSRGKIDYQDFSRLGGLAYGKLFVGKNVLGLNASFTQHKLNYYGYNHADTTLIIIPDSIKQRYNTIGAGISIGSALENDAEITYQLSLDYKNFGNIAKATENNINIYGNIDKALGENFEIGANSYFYYTNFKKNEFTTNLNALNITPTLTYRAAFGDFAVGASALLNKGKFYAFPYLNLQAHIIPEKLTLYGIWKKDVIENDYIALATANPFIDDELDIANSLRQERSIGVKGTIANTLSFNLKGFQTLTTQQALYTNKFTTPDRFSVLYDSLTTATGGQLELGVKLSTKLNATLTTTYQKYKLTNQTNAWHLPNLKTNLTVEVHPIEKLHLTTDFFVLQGIKARLANGSATNLTAIIDLNLAAKYDIIKNLSLFANINNIIGKQYVQYYNYPNYGFNALGGLILKF